MGPLSISVAASSWSSYSGGIYDGCHYDSNIQLNHGVQLVGYGSEDGQDFWIVRNSWGTSWGDGGNMRIARGLGHCGIGGLCTVPICAATTF